MRAMRSAASREISGDVAVGVHGQRDLAVAEDLHHDTGRDILCEQQTRRGMPQVVQPYRRKLAGRGDGQGGDDRGEGAAADQLQRDAPWLGGADPAEQHPEAVREVVGAGGEVSGALKAGRRG